MNVLLFDGRERTDAELVEISLFVTAEIEYCFKIYEGAAWLSLGFSVADLGCSVAQLGCSVAQIGCSVAQLGCRVAHLGCSVTHLGCNMA